MLKATTGLLILPLILGSCYSYRQVRQPDVIHSQTIDKSKAPLTVYTVNAKELPYEYDIVKKAGLYTFTSDSLCDQKMQLLPLNPITYSGLYIMEPLPIMVATLGQIPIRFEKRYTFHYYLINDGIPTEKQYELSIDKRIWFWDLFTFKKSRRNALAENLHNIAKN